MTQEEINKLADEYSAEYDRMFKKVARVAYIDGIMKGLDEFREKPVEL